MLGLNDIVEVNRRRKGKLRWRIPMTRGKVVKVTSKFVWVQHDPPTHVPNHVYPVTKCVPDRCTLIEQAQGPW